MSKASCSWLSCTTWQHCCSEATGLIVHGIDFRRVKDVAVAHVAAMAGAEGVGDAAGGSEGAAASSVATSTTSTLRSQIWRKRPGSRPPCLSLVSSPGGLVAACLQRHRAGALGQRRHRRRASQSARQC